MFFIEKNNIVEFQNRCSIALFLDYHEDIYFEEYVEKNHFRGRQKNENLIQDIYMFNVPEITAKEDKGIVYKYRGRHTQRNFRYIDFNDDYIKEYIKFNNNPYDYICRFFVERNWENKYNTLLVSDLDRINGEKDDSESKLVKYKSNPTSLEEDDYKYFYEEKSDVPDRLRFFLEALEGKLAFTKPKWLNDPFDCDCEIPIIELFPHMLRGAMLSTKYHEAATTAIDAKKLQKWWNDLNEEEKSRITELFDDLSTKNNEHKSDTQTDEARKIIDELYKKNQDKWLSNRKLDLIIEQYCSMRRRLLDLKNEFRILSLAHKENDILMWGYYGNSGKGLCLRHNQKDIRMGIIESPDAKMFHADFCIYGRMDYKRNKPKFNPTTGSGIDGILEYIIKCVFTKYEIWRHEDEYRYVLMGKDVKDSDAICIQSNLEHRFMGVKYEDVDLYKIMDATNSWPDNNQNVDYLKKHATNYKLVKR